MPSLTLSDRLIWFAHCPKAGGTSIERLMVDTWGEAVGHLHWGWDLWWRRGGWRSAGIANSPQHLVWRDAQAILPRAPDVVFALVRAPLARMQSEHRWQRHGRRGTLLGKTLAALPFSIWIRIMLALASRSPHAFDNHFRTQSDFIPPQAVIFRLEDGLTPVAAWLSEETRTALPPPTHALRTADPGDQADPRDAALIARVFASDHSRFGYSLPAECDPGRPILDGLAAFLARALAPFDARGLL